LNDKGFILDVILLPIILTRLLYPIELEYRRYVKCSVLWLWTDWWLRVTEISLYEKLMIRHTGLSQGFEFSWDACPFLLLMGLHTFFMSIVELWQLRRFILLDRYIIVLSELNDSNWIRTEYSTLHHEYFVLQALLQCTVIVIINETWDILWDDPISEFIRYLWGY